MRLFLVGIALLLGAIAAQPNSVQASDVREAAQDGDKKVCKYRQKTGTRFKTKDCRTSAQWKAMADEHARAAGELINRPQVKICGPNGCD